MRCEVAITSLNYLFIVLLFKTAFQTFQLKKEKKKEKQLRIYFYISKNIHVYISDTLFSYFDIVQLLWQNLYC